jgi:uncharacterized protein (DUF302 family)
MVDITTRQALDGLSVTTEKGMKRARCVYLLTLLVGWSLAQSQTATSSDSQKASRLSPEAMQVAQQIRVASLLERISDVRDGDDHHLIERLTVRQEISERLVGASLEIDSANADIDFEIEKIRSIRSDLQSKRDRAQNIINVASLVTGGTLGVVATALQFKSSTANVGNGIGVAGGASSVALSLIGIHLQSGGRRTLGDSPRMLAAFFGRAPDTPDVRSEYPEVAWEYLNSTMPSKPDAGSRKDQLIAKWRRDGRVEQEGSGNSRQPKLERATSDISTAKKLNIDALNDRVEMLLDVRATVNLMKRDLSEILMVSVRNSGSLRPENSEEVPMLPGTNQGIIDKPSSHSVDQTVDRLRSILQGKGVTLFALIDHSGEAEKAGMKMPPTKLLIFGNPKAGTPLMLAAPRSAIDLPLKILIWEDVQGKVWVSYNSPAYLQERYSLPQELLQNIAVVETLATKAAE